MADTTNAAVIHKTLLDIGRPANINGFEQITTAILLISEDEGLLTKLGKLRGKIAEIYGTKPANVERNIHHAATAFYKNCYNLKKREILGNNRNTEIPTQGEFISALYYYIEEKI